METPVYKRLGETIRRRINEGVYPLGSQLPTELEMVNEFNVSRMTVSKGLTELIEAGIIKRISGKSVSEWIDNYVILEAKTLLKYSNMSVQEIAYYLNFPNQSFFGSYFKRNAGMSPSQYKAKK